MPRSKEPRSFIRPASASRVEGLPAVETTPHDLMEAVATQLRGASASVADLAKEYHSAPLHELHMRGLTRALTAAEKSLAELAVHPDAAGYEYQLAQHGYMDLLAQVEELLMRIDEKAESGKKGEITLVGVPQDDQAAVALLRINEKRGLALPYWVVDYLATFAGDSDIWQYMQEEIDVDDEDDKLDNNYFDAMARPSGLQRREDLANASLGMLLRAVRTAGDDPQDLDGNRHRAANTFATLAEEWQRRYPPVAKRYEQLAHFLPQEIAVLEEHFYPERLPTEKKPAAKPVEATENIPTLQRLGQQMVEVTNLIYKLSLEHAKNGEQIEERLERAIAQASISLDALHRDTSLDDDDYNRLADQYMLLIMEVEDIINDLDLRLAENQTAPISVEWQWTTDKGIYSERLYRINADSELELPDWMVEYLAGMIYQHQEIQRYMKSPYDEQVEAEFDERYEELDRLEGFERRREAWELGIRLLMRAVKLRRQDPEDLEGNAHRVALLYGEVAKEWEQRFPPVAEKYEDLREMLPQIIELLDAAYFRY